MDPDEVNARNNFSLHAVFELALPLPAEEAERAAMVRELEEKIAELGVTVRGWYDVAGYRADADLMFWFLDESNDKLQDAYHAVLNSRLGAHLVPVWSIMSAHMTAEFNKPHLPACFGVGRRVPMPRFTPSCVPLEWYYLPKVKRSAMLAEHGRNGAGYLDVAVSTLATFALNDYEWSVTLESDDINRVMGVLRQQRDCEARLHVRQTPRSTLASGWNYPSGCSAKLPPSKLFLEIARNCFSSCLTSAEGLKSQLRRTF